ncbi:MULTISPECIES: DUF1330 domain-containing protein [Xanthomonas]|uniref:DUF1330 domain-containing protein n=1 Tax=Xanthomonas cucurbitae TaxID=56453 RepID=A0A2S7DRN2_9XANT|nr:DUF1330 domain-containing protein [Xanthomonas cucurbitae]PPU76483.1 hypothetical protein XcuCFBP2542_09595 [Xanthomonas cucurbitae]QHG88050.1 DUF1330 domain-containing protein [Xanthomonas cucurbitae]WDM66912.1 DUF1330 domain-containing protein [Xanthomonas cucurbitae]WDM70789.1 DUF1330 domain-containing protein [Xanthomonas cucurbitae]WDM74606.1 DUF1330 domain-containing protein [Xanthomonas cucurbitae]
MAAYWIAHVTVLDPHNYQNYMSLAPAAFAQYGARFLARGGPSVTLEGQELQRHVVIEFEDFATAQACYHSEAYQQAKAQRDGCCSAHIVIVDGIASLEAPVPRQ